MKIKLRTFKGLLRRHKNHRNILIILRLEIGVLKRDLKITDLIHSISKNSNNFSSYTEK